MTEEQRKHIENIILSFIFYGNNELEKRVKLNEEKKEFEKIMRWNHLLGFTDDKYKIIFSTRNSRSQKWKKKERRDEDGRNS